MYAFWRARSIRWAHSIVGEKHLEVGVLHTTLMLMASCSLWQHASLH